MSFAPAIAQTGDKNIRSAGYEIEVSIAGPFSHQSKYVRGIFQEISSVLGNACSHSLGLKVAIIPHLL
jgi:hypothetical protein